MARQLNPTAERTLVASRLAEKAKEIRLKYGPRIGWDELLRILADRSCVPYPCEVKFDPEPLLPGEFAHPAPKGSQREDGYIIYVHPVYADQVPMLPFLVLHQLVLANFGPGASVEDAERFGAQVLGLSQEEYYHTLCELAGQVGGDELA